MSNNTEGVKNNFIVFIQQTGDNNIGTSNLCVF